MTGVCTENNPACQRHLPESLVDKQYTCDYKCMWLWSAATCRCAKRWLHMSKVTKLASCNAILWTYCILVWLQLYLNNDLKKYLKEFTHFTFFNKHDKWLGFTCTPYLFQMQTYWLDIPPPSKPNPRVLYMCILFINWNPIIFYWVVSSMFFPDATMFCQWRCMHNYELPVQNNNIHKYLSAVVSTSNLLYCQVKNIWIIFDVYQQWHKVLAMKRYIHLIHNQHTQCKKITYQNNNIA